MWVQIIAASVFDENKNATRLLRIKIIDADDNDPVFLFGSKSDAVLTFIVDDMDGGELEKRKIGKVQAWDADQAPFNSVFYYLLPSCNPEANFFEIDHITGEVYQLKSNEANPKSDQVVCVLARLSPVSDVSQEILRQTEYDKANASMTRFEVQLMSVMMNVELSNQPQIPVENNTIVFFDSSPDNYQVPFDLTLSKASPESSQFLYKLQNLQFYPFKAPYGMPKPNIEVFVDPSTGGIRVDPEIIEMPQGIYKVNVEAYYISNGRHAGNLLSQLHRLNDNNRLKFVFDYPLEELGMRLKDFESRLEEVLSSNTTVGVIKPVFSAPNAYKDKKRTRSSVCFHLSRPQEIVSVNDSIRLTSTKMNANERLMSLYQIFEVINIDSCEAKASSSTADTAGTPMSESSVLFLAGILIFILILFSFIAYTCFVTRYREFLKKRNDKLKESKPPIEPFAIPQFIDYRRI